MSRSSFLKAYEEIANLEPMEMTFTINDADLDKLSEILKDVNVKECPYFEVQDKYGNVAKYYRKGYVPDTNVGDMISRQALINKAEYEAEAMAEPFKSQLPVLVAWLAEKIPSAEPERKKGK